MAKKVRRRAVLLSQVDQKRLEQGLTPSWEELPSREELDALSQIDLAHECDIFAATSTNRSSGTAPLATGGSKGSNDARLLSEVPPHW